MRPEPLAYPPTSAAAPEPTASPYFIPDDSHSPTTRGAGVPYSPPATRKRSRSSDTRRSSPAAASGATSPAAGTDKEATRRIRNAEASARCRYKKRQKEKKDHDRFTDMELQINKIWSKIVLYEAGNTDEGLNLLFSDKSTPDDIVRRLTTKVDRLINENRNLRLQIEALQAST
ncbi:hypothetical protein IWQ60_004071 [Tieghemiomyces parasiticus]|uniref:BZIP domain-containing protein n=1 Tax=Tieghemiomyces parasiticus TaxID=78921 RepID=A0A9W8DZH2_9FUNG|nr:hypothetical protein IWQ60_004071 [Tieghemiomyces parasiticus]